MTEYNYTETTRLDTLKTEVQAASFGPSKYVGMSKTDDGTTITTIVHTSSDLTAGEKEELDGIVAAHDPVIPTIADRIAAARLFGVGLIDSYQAMMIGEGVVQAGHAHELALKLNNSLVMAQAGNLYALDAELANVTPIATFLEQSRIVTMRNEVRTYLSIPLLWDAATSYAINDIVHHAGTDYQASAANTNDQPPSANWTAL